MNVNLSSLELWDDLEVKLLKLVDTVERVDSLLAGRIVSLVNHFNGNMSNNKQNVCIDAIDTIINNLSRKDYFIDRKYSATEEEEVNLILEDLILIDKVLKVEYKAILQNSKNIKEEIVEERLPNINNDKAMNMFKDIK